jgi:transcriptional regulator with XRE-family HTH domain
MPTQKTPNQVALGQAVKAVRTMAGKTQEQVANAIGMHVTYISDIERGARNPSWDAVARLATGIGVGTAAIATEYDRRRTAVA